jgi:hypothetical protein
MIQTYLSGKVYLNNNSEKHVTNRLQSGTVKTCTAYAEIVKDTFTSCGDLLQIYKLTMEQFFNYNPAVGSNCSNIWLGMNLHRPFNPLLTA